MYVLRQMRRLAKARGESELLAHLNHAIAHERHVLALDERWSGRSKRGQFSPDLVEIDNLTDQTLSGLRDVIRSFIRGAKEDDAMRILAEKLLATIFPVDVNAITSLPFVEQSTAVDTIVDKLTGESHDDAQTLGLGYHTKRLSNLADSYRAALIDDDQVLTFAEVKEAREQGQELLLQAVVLVLAAYLDDRDPSHVEARAELLAPVFEQDRATRRHIRARRRRAGEEPGGEEPGGEEPGGDDGDVVAGPDSGEPQQPPPAPIEQPSGPLSA
jgi:hypothetical protein